MKRREKYESETGFEGWGDYMGAKISKLENQFLHAAENVESKISDLFSGISIFVNGYTNPSADELKRLMMQHGGIYHTYKRPTTTYVIASNLPDVKVRSITSDVIISPQWVVDCIKKRRILDYKDYLLYTNHKPSQPKLTFGRLEKDVRKPVIKPDDKNDISKEDFLNLMSKLQVLNEKMKEFSNTESIASQKDESNKEQSISDETVNERTEIQLKDNNRPTSTALIESQLVSELNATTSPAKEQTTNLEGAESKRMSKTMTAMDPNFLAEFFNNSRLHHIATLGAGFKQHVCELRESHNGQFPDRATLQQLVTAGDEFGTSGPFIMHIDMDCFFVSVGLRKYPQLRGLPVAVTHSKGSESGKIQTRTGQNRSLEIELYQKRLEERYKTPLIPYESRLLNVDDNNSMSEIASCSYEAREKGVRNGMFVGPALKLCPDLKTISYDFEAYREVAFTLYNTIARYTLNIEAVSCDEMFVDLTELISSTGIDVMDFVRFVRTQIKEATGCPCSAGVGANRLQARLATKKAKPDGQFYLAPEIVLDYMRDIPISDLPGIGPSTSYKLKQLSWSTCGELLNISLSLLQREFGKKFGETIYQACRGIDEKPLVYDKVRKSVSVDVNYGIRFKQEADVERFMKQLCAEIHKRLMEIKKRGKLITLKLLVRSPDAPVETAKYMGCGICDVITKSSPLSEYTCDLAVIEKHVLTLMQQIKPVPHELRGIGIQISKFDEKSHRVESKNSLKILFQKAEAKNETLKINPIAMTGINSSKQFSEAVNISSLPKLEVSPTKIITITDPSTSSSTPKKSDNRIKSSTGKGGRGRGRPSKATILNKTRQNYDLHKFLKETNQYPKKESIPEGLDAEVLAALPEDIRAEVIKDYKLQMKPLAQTSSMSEPTPSTSASASLDTFKSDKINVDIKFLQALPPALRQEVEKQIELQRDTMVITSSEPEFTEHLQVTPENSPGKKFPSVCSSPTPALEPAANCKEINKKQLTTKSEPDNVFLRSDWRPLLREWVDSSEYPEQVDVDMIAENARNLAKSKRLTELHLGLRYLFRIIDESRSCPWHQAYLTIISATQAGMYEVYQTKLAVRSDFRCSKKECCKPTV